jgi:3-methyladenine DNA glycosylase AlkD
MKTSSQVKKYYQEIAEGVKELGKGKASSGNSYIGTSKAHLGIKIPILRSFVRGWANDHRDISSEEICKLIGLLSKSNIHEEIQAASMLLQLLPDLRRQIDPFYLDEWLDNVEGWAEVDAFCQSKFMGREMLSNWAKWKRLLLKLAQSKNPHKKRASLVLLTGPTREVSDSRLVGLALRLIDKHKSEKDILITKAISWLLREMIKNYREEVEKYLSENELNLPRIAVRETRNKLKNGKKYG